MVEYRRKPRYVQVFRDRHGRERLYFRKPGDKLVPLRGPLGSDAFEIDYATACSASASALLAKPTTASPHTYRWLCLKYLKSTDFKQLASSTQRVRELIIEHTWAEPIEPGSAVLIGDCPLSRFNAKIIRVLRDRKHATPHAANNRLKAIGYVLAWGVENELLDANPARDVQHIKAVDGGHHTWTDDEIAKFEKRWPIGTKARLAFDLLRYLGVRRSDVVRIGRQHMKGGALCFTTKKCPAELALPIPPLLQQTLDASETGDLTFLLTEQGKSFTNAGFGMWFRERCDAAGLSACSAHGLRKAAATSLAEAGATAHELMAWFGWRSIKEAQRYTEAANRKKLTSRVVKMIGKGS